MLSISAIDGILGTEYHHLLSIHTTIEKVLAGLVFAAAVLVIGIVCCQALKSQMRRVERVQVVLQLLLAILCMAYVVLAAVFGIIPMVPLGMGHRHCPTHSCPNLHAGATASQSGQGPEHEETIQLYERC